MSTIFEFRRASDSRWIRQEEDVWVRPTRSKSPESRISSSGALRSSLGPIGELLACERDALPDLGRDAIRWLDQLNSLQTPALDWFSRQTSSGWIFGRPIGDHNRIAAIEILARYNHSSAPRLVDRYLSEPIREYHLYVLPLARLPQVGRSLEAGSIGRRIVQLYGESKAIQPEARWRERFAVEAFRSLVDLSPNDVVGVLASDLENIADLELTPILESVSLAARKVDGDRLSQSPFKTALRAVWDRYIKDGSTENVGNKPGILGRVLELLGRAGEDLAPFWALLKGHPLGTRILYQFVRRPLEFASSETRLRWYRDVMVLMIEAKQDFALRKFLIEVVVPDMPPELQKTIIGTFAGS